MPLFGKSKRGYYLRNIISEKGDINAVVHLMINQFLKFVYLRKEQTLL